MHLLQIPSVAHNPIFHVLYHFFLISQIACAVVFLLFPVSYANEYGATVLTVPVAAEAFPDDQEALKTLLHHERGLKEPRIYKNKKNQHYKDAIQLTPNWFKKYSEPSSFCFVREKSATKVQLTQYSFSQAIKLIESNQCQDDVSIVSVLDKKIAHIFQKMCNKLPSLPFLGSLPFPGIEQYSINFINLQSPLHPLDYEKKKVPITFHIPFNRWKKMFQHHPSTHKNTNKTLSCTHKKFQLTFDKTSFTLPTYITFLDMSNTRHVEHLHQNMRDVSRIIIQTYGRQKVVLMPPISAHHPYHHLLDSTGQFLFKEEIDLSTPDSLLNNESSLAHITLYSVHLNPGEILLVPANWFIYRKSLETSISISLNYLSGDQWHFFSSQAESMQRKYLAQEKYTVGAWANREIQRICPQHPRKALRIRKIHDAYTKIQTAISDTTKSVLDLRYLELKSLPKAISRIPHLKTMHLSCNRLTSFSLSYQHNLVFLNLSGNELTSFSLSHVKNLTSLNLSCNKLTSFSLSHMKNLTSLNLSCNSFTSISLSHMKNLVSLNLLGNELSNLLACDLPSVRYLNIDYNTMSHLEPNCTSSINTN